jgi:DNA replication and repair protein RecF
MYLERLRLHHFKNYEDALFRFSPQLNCITGLNGAGKTNVLDAIYYLSFTRSYFNPVDQQNISHTASQMVIDGTFRDENSSSQVVIAVERGAKKTVRVNNNDYRKFSEHIGSFPVVIITPGDIRLIHEGSEERRRFMDGFISQYDKVYLATLLDYNRVLEQRNHALKRFAESRTFDRNLLESYNDQLATSGSTIHEKRKQFAAAFTPVFSEYYRVISSGNDMVNLDYISDLQQDSFATLLHAAEQADISAMRTTRGIHKDDLDFGINGYALKKFGSQGQQKSFIIALKLAQLRHLKELKKFTPLLLLDDIFEKLDADRLEKLLTFVTEGEFGQVFITDTHVQRLREVFGAGTENAYFMIEDGKLSTTAP